MKQYRHLFFDLDHTLWDFRANSRETLRELHVELGLAQHGVEDVDELISVYEDVNRGLWKRYEAGHLNKEVLRVLRFRNTLLQFGIRNEPLATRMGEAYLEQCPLKPNLFQGTQALLQDLSAQYRLHIITNGFHEVQQVKLRSSGIHHHFDVVLSSEKAGAGKPDPRIFAKALAMSGAKVEESLMIGDDHETDMRGARNAGWDQVHFAAENTPDTSATYRVAHMDELRPILL
jgi:putative hydrolase of the HAD superfamily